MRNFIWVAIQAMDTQEWCQWERIRTRWEMALDGMGRM